MYLQEAFNRRFKNEEKITIEGIREAVIDGATLRLRPVLMTALTTGLGLIPLLLSTGGVMLLLMMLLN